jgi:putative SOS response-associated peptidase YedK
MCGRFTLTLDLPQLQQQLGLGEIRATTIPRYNVAPSQPVAVVSDPEERAIELMQWGLVPFWADDPSIGSRMINARSETVAEKPAFRTPFAQRRCLVLADGFYEWNRPQGKSGPAIPYFYRLKEGQPFAFAGLWDNWKPKQGNGDELRTCTIITCPANELVSQVHPRMPVVLSGDNMWRWLELDSRKELQALLTPYPAEEMESFQVSRSVNRPDVDQPSLLEPVSE